MCALPTLEMGSWLRANPSGREYSQTPLQSELMAIKPAKKGRKTVKTWRAFANQIVGPNFAPRPSFNHPLANQND